MTPVHSIHKFRCVIRFYIVILLLFCYFLLILKCPYFEKTENGSGEKKGKQCSSNAKLQSSKRINEKKHGQKGESLSGVIAPVEKGNKVLYLFVFKSFEFI